MSCPFGLVRIPDGADDVVDFPAAAIKRASCVAVEYSPGDRAILRDALRSVFDCRCIVEIGVARKPGSESSTHVLLQDRPPGAWYFGVDVRLKKFVRGDRVCVIQTSSSNIEFVMDEIERYTHRRGIDFLHVDGNHSVRQVLDDWRYMQYLSSDGCAVFHDTNWHSGPKAVLGEVDSRVFSVNWHFRGDDNDWGVAEVRRCALP